VPELDAAILNRLRPLGTRGFPGRRRLGVRRDERLRGLPLLGSRLPALKRPLPLWPDKAELAAADNDPVIARASERKY